jgi:hypothetical protein
MVDTAIGRKGSLLVFLLIACGANAETSVLDSVVQVVASKELPWFCHGIDCPEFTVDENFTAVASACQFLMLATRSAVLSSNAYPLTPLYNHSFKGSLQAPVIWANVPKFTSSVI